MIIIIKQYKVSVYNLKERVFFLKIKKKKNLSWWEISCWLYIYIYMQVF